MEVSNADRVVFPDDGITKGEVVDHYLRVAERMLELSWLEVGQLAASGLAGWFVLLGVLRIRASRAAALRMFERAIVTSILLVQVFSFYSERFAALLELVFNLSILALVRAAVRVEEEREADPGRALVRPPGRP